MNKEVQNGLLAKIVCEIKVKIYLSKMLIICVSNLSQICMLALSFNQDWKQENLSKKFKIGEIYEGTCTKLMDYGVFVKLEEGIEGLIHNSELSWQNRNIQPSKVLSPSQNVKVKIINIDKDAKRISLSYKPISINFLMWSISLGWSHNLWNNCFLKENKSNLAATYW